MKFDPVAAATEIEESYRNYVRTTFRIRDPEYQSLFEGEIATRELARGPYLEAVDAFEEGRSVRELITDEVLHPEFATLFRNSSMLLERPLFRHQDTAIEKAVNGENLVVSTGTGSGKTEAFLYPILNHLLDTEEREGELGPGVRALLLYPMNALANDQMKRLRDLLLDYPSITFGSYTGETEHTRREAEMRFRKIHRSEPSVNERISRDEIKDSPPHLLVTNYAMLEYLLLRPSDSTLFHGEYADTWRFIVLDEAHSYRGATGMEVSLLLRRLVHTLPNPGSLQFILTSATLGAERDNPAIQSFASSLCDGREFGRGSVVRAIRKRTPELGVTKEIRPDEFIRIDEAIHRDDESPIVMARNLEEVLSDRISGSDTNQIAESLGHHIITTTIFRRLRSALTDSLSVKDLASALGVPLETIPPIVRVASFATYKGQKLLDARYHHFVRTLEGAYVTLGPHKTLTVEPLKERLIDGRMVPAFEISVCQYCGAIYIDGYQKEGVFLQSKAISDHYMVVDKTEIDRLIEDGSDATETLKQIYSLCGQCGKITRGVDSKPCDCDPVNHVQLLKAEVGNSTNVLNRCRQCGSTNPNGSVLRGFYVGQHAAASVIGSSLYEQLPSKKTVKTEIIPAMGGSHQRKVTKYSKQLLVFSDSRQDAAFFAPYFERTYENIMRRRLILMSARELSAENEGFAAEGIDLVSLAARVGRKFEIDLKIPSQDANREAWKSLFYEIQTGDRNGLTNMGLLDFSYQSHMESGHPPFESPDELRLVDESLVDTFLRQTAIAEPEGIQFTEDDRRYFAFHGRPVTVQLGPRLPGSSGATVWWVSNQNNARIDLLRKTARFAGDEEIKDFLREHFEVTTNPGNNYVVERTDGFQLVPSTIVVRVDGVHPLKWFRCDTCGRTTPRNIDGVCGHYRCRGRLQPFDPQGEFSYFRHQLEQSIVYPMVVKEHTAQLSPKTAATYQQRFIGGDINVLSSSTTFEMGVDVGDLETVFMRNVPPSPANYVQRAGRAGRRTDSAAYALTFCRLTNHDLSYFREPHRIIAGTILPPVFKLDNEKIVRRHIYATLLSRFWREHPTLNSVSDVFSDETFESFQQFLDRLNPKTLRYIRSFVPPEIPDEKIQELIEEYGGPSGRLSVVREWYVSEYNELSKMIEDYRSDDAKLGTANYLRKQRDSLEREKIIDRFSRANLIPKYGFPVDTVELKTDLSRLSAYRNPDAKLRLQRDLIQAITDYAPGSEVIADGLRYTSAYIQPPWRKDQKWEQYQYGHCKNPDCGTLNFNRYYEEEALITNTKPCVACGTEVKLRDVFLVPSQGFIVSTESPPKATSRPPRKTGRTAIHYKGDAYGNSLSERTHRMGPFEVEVVTAQNDELVVMNRSAFYVCHECGYSELAGEVGGPSSKTKQHYTPKGKNCFNKKLIRKSLGHTFQTDVTLVSIDQYLKHDQALSIMYSILEGCSRTFGIERDDIDGTLTYRFPDDDTPKTIFVLFDTVPGGAGHVKRIADLDTNGLDKLFSSALLIVDGCTCGDSGDGNAACYSCLCNYRNQIHHDVLKRKYAINFFKEMGIS
jgi:hypothetical protein